MKLEVQYDLLICASTSGPAVRYALTTMFAYICAPYCRVREEPQSYAGDTDLNLPPWACDSSPAGSRLEMRGKPCSQCSPTVSSTVPSFSTTITSVIMLRSVARASSRLNAVSRPAARYSHCRWNTNGVLTLVLELKRVLGVAFTKE